MWPLNFQLLLARFLDVHDLLQLSWVKRDMVSDHCWTLRIELDFPLDTHLIDVPLEDHPDDPLSRQKTRYWMLRPIFFLCRASAAHYWRVYLNYWAVWERRMDLLTQHAATSHDVGEEFYGMLRLAILSGSYSNFKHIRDKEPTYKLEHFNFIFPAVASGIDTSHLMTKWLEDWNKLPVREQLTLFQMMLEGKLAGWMRRGRKTDVDPELQVITVLQECASILPLVLGQKPVFHPNNQQQAIPLPAWAPNWAWLIRAALLGGEVLLHDWIVQQAQAYGLADPTAWQFLDEDVGRHYEPWEDGPEDVKLELLAHHLQGQEAPVLLRAAHEVGDGTLTRERMEQYAQEYAESITQSGNKVSRKDHVKKAYQVILVVAIKYRRLRIISWTLPHCPCEIHPWLSYVHADD